MKLTVKRVVEIVDDLKNKIDSLEKELVNLRKGRNKTSQNWEVGINKDERYVVKFLYAELVKNREILEAILLSPITTYEEELIEFIENEFDDGDREGKAPDFGLDEKLNEELELLRGKKVPPKKGKISKSKEL